MARDRKPRSDVPTFESKEERDRWQIAKYGHVRNGFRTEGEPVDERPLLVYHSPPFRDRLEQATYEAAVAMNPRRDGEGAFSYVRRISEFVTQERVAGARPMPHARMSRREQDEQLTKLRGQVTAQREEKPCEST